MVDIRTVRDPLAAPVAQAVRSLAERAHEVDGVPPLSEQPLLWLSDAAAPAAHLLAEGPDGALLGYAQLDLRASEGATAEIAVDPAARRQGVGRSLVESAQALAAERAGRLTAWAHGDLPAAQALAATVGMEPVQELWQMRMPLAPGPAAGAEQAEEPRPDPATQDGGRLPAGVTLAAGVTLPAGVTVREFVPGQDEDAWVRLNARAFADHPTQGRLTRTDLLAREAEPWFDATGFWLAERDGRLLGSMWTKVAEPGVGEIYALGIDPDAQGLGLGGALTALAVQALRDRGLETAELYTSGDNHRAIRTYARAGFARSSLDVMYGTPAPITPSVTR